MKRLFYDPGLSTIEVVSTFVFENLVTATPLVVDKRINIVFYAKIILSFRTSSIMGARLGHS